MSAQQVTYRYLYARLLLAMSLEKALDILGFPPGSNPSPEDVRRSQKKLTVKYHPDLGGDPVKMVEVNVAADVLTGKQRPTGPGGRESPGAPPGGWQPRDKTPKPEPPPPPPPVEGKSFSQAVASIPGGVRWKFVSELAFAQVLQPLPNSERHFFRNIWGWFVYGQTDTHHVFAGVRAETNSVSWAKALQSKDVGWDAFYVTAKIDLNISKLAPKMIKQTIASIPDLGHSKVPRKFNVVNVTSLSEALFQDRGKMSLKDALVLSGAVPEGSTQRKILVAITPEFSREKYKKYNESGVKGEYYRAFLWTVEVDNASVTLTDTEVDRLDKNHFLAGVYNYDYDIGRKVLTRLRGGWLKFSAADALRLLAEAMNSGSLKEKVELAAKQMAETKKAADLAARWKAHG